MKDDPMECPLCMEPLEIDDVNFFPCTCGYQICRFCWHRIRTDENGLCPACRKVQKRFIGPSASAYVTYIRSEDALRAIQCVNNVVVDGRTLKDQSPLSPGPLSQGGSHSSGLPSSNPSTSHHFPSGLPRVHQLHHRAIYSSFSFPGGHNSQASQQQPPAARHPWMGIPTRNNLAHLNHSASAASHSNILDLNLPPQHNTGLGGIPISGTTRLDCLQDDNPPHWLKSLQALTEMDGPASSAVPTPQPLHSGLLDGHLPLHHRAPSGWAPYLPPPTANPTGQFHSPPPGFQTAFRPPGQPATELLQSAAVDRH
ncbi:hypothetical protein XENOCAPTIV_030692 [Xenoophorus captivus]|uniref:RING-type domain-containing protein n=1 Tax=Xenoophorus captivus TaxID=1517983 RepID=A0ABV0QXH4_9TELE